MAINMHIKDRCELVTYFQCVLTERKIVLK